MVASLPALLMVLICCDLRIWTFATAEGYEELVMYRSINIQCTENGITILLTKKHLPSFDHSSFHLNNNSCTGHQLNHSHIILETGLSDCGTIKRSFNDSYDVHTNLVQGHLKNLYNGRSKNITTRFAVECNPPSAPATRNETPQSDTNLRKVVSKEVYVKDEPLAKTRPPLLANEAMFIKPPNVTFKAVETKTVNNGEEVFFTAQVSSNVKGEGLIQSFIAVEDCRATPDNTFNSKDGVTLIENGCVRKPGLCGYMFKSRSFSQTISYKLSASGNQKPRTMYVHCRFVLCPKVDLLSLCRVGCGGVGKKVNSEQKVTVVFQVEPLAISGKAQGPRGLDLGIIIGGVIFLLLAAVSILIFYCKRRRRLKRRDALLYNEEGLSDNERGFDQGDDTAVFEESSETREPQLSDETYSCSILEERKLFLNMDWTTV